MKTTLSLLLLPFFFLLIGCTKDIKTPDNQSIEGKLVSQSECKQFILKSTKSGTNESCLEYSFNALTEKLVIKHINAGFNCCPGELYCIVTSSNDTIIIEEFESQAPCNCNCLFDLDIEVTGIKVDQYFIKVIEPYIQGQEKLEFSIDLQQNPSGDYCVERNQYPWGI